MHNNTNKNKLLNISLSPRLLGNKLETSTVSLCPLLYQSAYFLSYENYCVDNVQVTLRKFKTSNYHCYQFWFSRNRKNLLQAEKILGLSPRFAKFDRSRYNHIELTSDETISNFLSRTNLIQTWRTSCRTPFSWCVT